MPSAGPKCSKLSPIYPPLREVVVQGCERPPVLKTAAEANAALLRDALEGLAVPSYAKGRYKDSPWMQE